MTFRPGHARRLIALVVSALLLSAGPAGAEPALWVARGRHATVYLFGTVHVLRKHTAWRSPKIAAALARSDDLWLEVAGSNDAETLRPVMARWGLDPAHPLSSKVNSAKLARIDAAARSAGLNGEAALEPMRPWLAGLTLTVAPVIQAGYDPASGVDKLLKSEAIAAGKPVRGFETAEQQLRFFADLSPRLELQFLDASLDDVDGGPAKLDALVGAWARGDVESLARLETEELERASPALYRTLIVRRNAAWADRLAKRLQGRGVSFVAVGAGHLAGRHSLQRQLQARRFKVERR